MNRDYSAVHVLPSYLRRRRSDRGSESKPKKAKVIKQWDRDVVCFPRNARGVGNTVKFPRGKYKAYLASCGLMGKLHMTSEMDEEDVASEIRGIFKRQMNNDSNFRFQYLQAAGGGTNLLTVPAQSPSFKWTPQQVSRLSGQAGIIYILAQDELTLNDDEVWYPL